MPARKVPPTPPLSRARVLTAAIGVADDGGVVAVTMRRVADALGVEAMSLYHHVAGKDDILDGMVDVVFSQIALPDTDTDWRAAMKRRARSARQALSRHAWVLTLVESRRNPGPATLRHHEAVLASLRRAGFSVLEAGVAFAALDSYVYGYVLQESNLPFSTEQELDLIVTELAAEPETPYPHLTEMLGAYARQPTAAPDAYEVGLELLLDGLERRRLAQGAGSDQ
jgi:AcrR family transcriptional regulator